jgi:hypothetical protein
LVQIPNSSTVLSLSESFGGSFPAAQDAVSPAALTTVTAGLRRLSFRLTSLHAFATVLEFNSPSPGTSHRTVNVGFSFFFSDWALTGDAKSSDAAMRISVIRMISSPSI